MSTHNLFAPSAAHRWMRCPGSVLLCAGLPDSSSSYADEGSAAHALAARALTYSKDASFFQGERVRIGDKDWEFTEEMCGYVQIYLDYVYSLTNPSEVILPEQHVSVDGITDGTSDVVIYAPWSHTIKIVDLKYGKGVAVLAEDNEQESLYALGAIDSIAALFGDRIERALLAIVQPRLDTISESWVSREQLETVRHRAAAAAIAAYRQPPDLHPSETACRWCPVKATCPALAAKVEAEIAQEFGDATPSVAGATLADRWAALPLIRQYVDATERAALEAVSSGQTLVGPDGMPLKLVRGRSGNRRWENPELAGQQLATIIGPQAYREPEVVTPAVADKLINKGRKQKTPMWDQVVAPLIVTPPGSPILALGSDEREAYSTALAQEFVI